MTPDPSIQFLDQIIREETEKILRATASRNQAMKLRERILSYTNELSPYIPKDVQIIRAPNQPIHFASCDSTRGKPCNCPWNKEALDAPSP